MSLETTIKISRSLRATLQAQKQPHETYNDYIVRLVQENIRGDFHESS